MSAGRYRLVVVDDHALFRRGLVSLLGDMPEFEVVGEAGDGREALGVIEQTHPDILLLDVNMPRMDGIALVQELRRSKSNPAHPDADHLARRQRSDRGDPRGGQRVYPEERRT